MAWRDLLTRRHLLRRGGGIAAAAGYSEAADGLRIGPGIYESLGVKPILNARGTITVIGGSRPLPEVKRAMEEASKQFVHLDELAEGIGRRLAQLTGAEWGTVTSGCAAALTLATAACAAGSDPDKLARLPDLTGMRNEVIMPAYSRVAYDHVLRAAGVRILEVATPRELELAVGPNTVMIMVVSGPDSDRGPLSLPEIVRRAEGVPVLVDAAAEELRVPNPHLSRGAALVAYSGGKCLRGPQCAGLLLGRKDLARAAWIIGAPHHGFARGYKVGKEEMVGMLAAVEMWMKRDHAREQQLWRSWLEHIADRVRSVPGVTAEIREPAGLSNRTPSLTVRWDGSRIPLLGHEVEELLYEGSPRVAVGGAGSFLPFPPNSTRSISIVPYQMEAGEEKIVAARVAEVLSHPPGLSPPLPPAGSVAGVWRVRIGFVCGTASHVLSVTQSGDKLGGLHQGEFATRTIEGFMRGRDVVLRSSYTRQGVRLNFTFRGTWQGDRMSGEVHLGEYGSASWVATRI